jgi:hypothetical protein
MSKVFATAKQWGYFPGDNPAIGVGLPEKKAVREKHVLLPEQIPPLLAILGEPVNTMVLLGVLTGLRIGEILGLPRGKTKEEYLSLIFSETLGTKIGPSDVYSSKNQELTSSFLKSGSGGTFFLKKSQDNRTVQVTVGLPEWLADVLKKDNSVYHPIQK